MNWRWKLMLLASIPAALALAQVAQDANRGYQTEQGRANVAKGLAGDKRDEEQKPKQLIADMALREGSTVADIGTGVGYMLPYLSEAVGPSGKVMAEDIFPDFLDKARARAGEFHLSNVEFIQGAERDPHLPPNSVDAILMLEVYHHLNYPGEMLHHLADAMRPGAKFYLVDFHKRTGDNHIRADKDEVIEEVTSNGFRLVSAAERGTDKQYMAVFEKK